jgi:hypothetical protein
LETAIDTNRSPEEIWVHRTGQSQNQRLCWFSSEKLRSYSICFQVAKSETYLWSVCSHESWRISWRRPLLFLYKTSNGLAVVLFQWWASQQNKERRAGCISWCLHSILFKNVSRWVLSSNPEWTWSLASRYIRTPNLI